MGNIDAVPTVTEFAGIQGVKTTATSGGTSGELVFLTRGVTGILERARITFAGDVGIGTPSPGTLLHAFKAGTPLSYGTEVVAAFQRSSSSAGAAVAITSDSDSFLYMGDNEDVSIGRIKYDNDDNSMSFFTNNAEQMEINNSGQVGIGISPTTRLHVLQNDTHSYDPTTTTVTDLNNLITIETDNDASVASGTFSGLRLGGGGSTNAAQFVYLGCKAGVAYANTAFVLGMRTSSTAIAEYMRVLNNGFVGIGTTGPGVRLEARGDVVDTATTNYYPSIRSRNNLSGGSQRVTDIGGFQFSTYIQSWDTGSTFTNLLLNPRGGNVGISDTSPDARLRVASAGNSLTDYTARFSSSGSVSGAGGFLFDQNSTYAWKVHSIGTGNLNGSTLIYSLIQRSDGAVQFDNNLVLRQGRVGVGLLAPQQLFHAHSSTGGPQLALTNDASGSTSTDGLAVGMASDASSAWIWFYENSPLRFATNNNEKMRLDQNGNLGIGITPSKRLHVDEPGSASTQTIVACIASSTSQRPVLLFSESTLSTISSGMSIEYDGRLTGNDNKMYVNNVSGSPVLTITSGGNVDISNGTLSVAKPRIATLKDQKPSGTASGTFTSGAWQTRTLNTEVDADGIVTLSSNQFTLGAGTYYIYAIAPGYRCNLHKSRLRNITDSSTALVGESSYADVGADGEQTVSTLFGLVTVATNKVFELQHRCATTSATNGFGFPSSFDEVEVYAQVVIQQLN